MAEHHAVSEILASRLVGLTVRQLVIPPVWLGLERALSGAPFEGLQFETPFELSIGAEIYRLHPAALESCVGSEHLFGLYGRQVIGTSVSASGDLQVRLDHGVQLFAPAHADFESWSLAAPVYGTPSVVCTPGRQIGPWGR
jgi:hypothetical protein